MRFDAYSMRDKIDYAYKIVPVGVVAECMAIIIVNFCFSQVFGWWVAVSSFLMMFRVAFLVVGCRLQRFKYHCYVASFLFSLSIWFVFSLFFSAVNYTNALFSVLLLSGVVAIETLFLVFVPFLSMVYAVLTLGVFCLFIIMKGGIFLYIGTGLLILIGYLINLSIKYDSFITSFFELSRQSNELISLNNKKAKELSLMQDKIKHEIHNTACLEAKIVSSNDEVDAIISDSIIMQDINLVQLTEVVKHVDFGLLIINHKREVLLVNDQFFELFCFDAPTKNINEIIDHFDCICQERSLFSYVFPFELKMGDLNFSLKLSGVGDFSCHLKSFSHDVSGLNYWYFYDKNKEDVTNSDEYHMANFDSLTGLPARSVIFERLDFYIKHANDASNLFAVIFIDLDDFKLHNDAMGHAAGNEILMQIATILNEFKRDDDFVGRLGGDEFIYIFKHLTYKSDLDPLISQLCDVLQKKLVIDGRYIYLSASLGASFYPCDSVDKNELVSFADIAMYQAKLMKSTYSRYQPSYSTTLYTKHKNIQQLRSCIENNELFLMFQPIYDVKTSTICRAEALLRWDKGVPPSTFIPLAEEIDLIDEIGLWVLAQTCKACTYINQKVNEDILFSLNVSTNQLSKRSKIDTFFSMFEQMQVDYTLIEFEFTENEMLNRDLAAHFIERAQQLGSRIAIDDFGSGYASLLYLVEFQFNTIKIDKALLDNIHKDPKDFEILMTIIELSKSIGSQIVLEGIETKQQLEFCHHNNCHFAQGFYLSKPIALDALLDKLLASSIFKPATSGPIFPQSMMPRD